MSSGKGRKRIEQVMERAMLGHSFSLTNERHCMGVREGEKSGEVVLTFNNGAVKAYNVDDHSCVNSWQLSTSHQITSPAVFHHLSGRYWAVRDDNEVINWLTEDYQSQTIHSNIHCLLVSGDHTHPLIVFKDGHVSMLDVTDQSDHLRSTRRTRRSLVHSTTTIHHDGGVWVCVVHSVDKCASVSMWRMKSDSVELMSQTPLSTAEGEMTACCVCGEKLIVLSSDGYLSSCSLLPLFQRSTSIQLTLSPHCKLPHPPITLCSVSCGYFVLADVRGGVVNSSLWDTTYFACQSVQSSPLTKLHSLNYFGGYVLACGDGVMVCSVRNVESEGVLAGALGSASIQDCSPTMILTGWRKPEDIVDANDTTDGQKMTELIDRDKTPTLKRFKKAFSLRPLTPGLDYTKVVQRLLEETEFWARESIMEIISAKLFPQSLSDQLVRVALDKEDWVVVKTWLEVCLGNTAELSIVQLLEAVLNLPDQLECHDVTLTRDQLLRLVLDQPFNDVMMYQPLSQLSFSVVMNLLRFLSSCINVKQFFSGPQHTSHTPHYKSYDHLIEWTGLLLDVHFAVLALHPEARQLLVSLRQSVFRQVQCFNNLSVVLQVGGAGGKWSEERNDWQYKIEKMDITV